MQLHQCLINDEIQPSLAPTELQSRLSATKPLDPKSLARSVYGFLNFSFYIESVSIDFTTDAS